MIIDVNTYIGSWAFRRIRYNDAKGLYGYLSEANVKKACVSSIDSVLYRNVQEGNLQLIEDIKGFEDFFLPFAIINPTYPGWKEDFYNCVHRLNMKGLEFTDLKEGEKKNIMHKNLEGLLKL